MRDCGHPQRPPKAASGRLRRPPAAASGRLRRPRLAWGWIPGNGRKCCYFIGFKQMRTISLKSRHGELGIRGGARCWGSRRRPPPPPRRAHASPQGELNIQSVRTGFTPSLQ